MEIAVELDTHATIGESALWDPVAGVLYWADIKAPALYRYDPRTGENRRWPVTGDLGAFALLEGEGALVALRDGLFRLDLRSGTLDRLAPPPHDPALFRFNEGAWPVLGGRDVRSPDCRIAGAFWPDAQLHAGGRAAGRERQGGTAQRFRLGPGRPQLLRRPQPSAAGLPLRFHP
ncbi:hypothetical protein GI374_05575 [Paracoccus sp. S-4012]|nr:hypothetical protein [Paracoccus sp. S-4012]